jgi:hypothetical protein
MKAAKLFLLVIFAITIAISAKAQDKYEYATVLYSGNGALLKGTITISYEDKYEESEVRVTEGNTVKNLSPAMSTLNKMSKAGWEISNATSMVNAQFYLLRRKKN